MRAHLHSVSTPTPPPRTAADASINLVSPTAVKAHGSLTHGRQSEILRTENGIMNLVHNWDQRAIVTAKAINEMKYSQKNMIVHDIKPILAAVKVPNHEMTTTKGSFRNLFETAASEPVRCWETNGDRIEGLISQTIGGMKAKYFKVEVNDSTLGKLNKYLAVLRTYVSEEMDPGLRYAADAALHPTLKHNTYCVSHECVNAQRRRGDPRPACLCGRELEEAPATARCVGCGSEHLAQPAEPAQARLRSGDGGYASGCCTCGCCSGGLSKG